MGFHGDSGEVGSDPTLEIGNRSQITLQQLEDWIDGRCKGRLIYFGSCYVMQTHGHRLKRFVRNTQSVAVAGYREEIDWLEAAAFDTLALHQIQNAAFTKSSIEAFDRHLNQTAPGLYERLGFRLVTKD